MTQPTRIALVTGASRGLGLVIARVLARRGYGLVIAGRDRDALASAALELSRRNLYIREIYNYHNIFFITQPIPKKL